VIRRSFAGVASTRSAEHTCPVGTAAAGVSAKHDRLDSANQEPYGGGEAVSVDAGIPDRQIGREPEERGEEEDGGFARVDLRANAAEALLGGEVGGDGIRRARQRCASLGQDALALGG
jgi:hypothetical protein